MSARSFSTAMELKAKLDQFEGELGSLRSCGPLTKGVVEKAFDDAARARASLTSSGMKRDPHEKDIPSDAHITGLVGGLSRKRPSQMIWGEVLRAKRSGEPMLLVPMERSIRPMNAKGETPFYANVEVVSKARTTGASSSKSAKAGSARGPRANAGQHVDYIERDDARPKNDLLASTAITADAFTKYQERADGIELDEDGAALLWTSIRGTTEHRVEFFGKIQKREPEGNETTLTITDAGEGSEGRRFLVLASHHDELKKVVAGWQPGAVIAVPPEMHGSALQLLEHEIGWTPKESTEKRKGKAEEGGDAAAREELEVEREKTGIRYVKGRSGRVQHRLVGELPHEVSPLGRRRICAGIAKEFRKRGVPYVLVLHAPNYANDERNWHFHLVWHERPTRVFTGRAEDHLPYVARRMSKFAKAALSDPAVQQCKGMWDFEVPYTYRDKSRRWRTVYPFEQNKDRWFKSKGFVPLLRKQLADLTNAELERAGRERRVFNGTMADNDIDKLGGDKLHDKAKKDELAGIPTAIGTLNEQKQWDYQMRQLQRRHDAERLEVPKEWDRLVADARPEDLPEEPVLSRHRASWINFRYEELALRHQARRAREIAARALSRPTQMLDSAYNHLEAALDPSAPAKLRRQVPKHIATVEMASEHTAVLQDLFHDRFRLRLEAEELAAERAELCRTILEVAGLRRQPEFDVGTPPPPQVDRTVTRRASAQLAQTIPTSSRVAEAPATKPTPPVTETAAPVPPISPPVPDYSTAARKLVADLARGKRRLITLNGVCRPRLLSKEEIEVVRSDTYRQHAQRQRLEEVQASQERTITDLVKLIKSQPDSVRVVPQMTASEPAYRLNSDRFDLVHEFGFLSREPEILDAIKATEGQRQSAAAKAQASNAARSFANDIKPEQEEQNRSLKDRLSAEEPPILRGNEEAHAGSAKEARANCGNRSAVTSRAPEAKERDERMQDAIEVARRFRQQAPGNSVDSPPAEHPRKIAAPAVERESVPHAPIAGLAPETSEGEPERRPEKVATPDGVDVTEPDGELDLRQELAKRRAEQELWILKADRSAEYIAERERKRMEAAEEVHRGTAAAPPAVPSQKLAAAPVTVASPPPDAGIDERVGSDTSAICPDDMSQHSGNAGENARSQETPAAPAAPSGDVKALDAMTERQAIAIKQAHLAMLHDRGR